VDQADVEEPQAGADRSEDAAPKPEAPKWEPHFRGAFQDGDRVRGWIGEGEELWSGY
jgi:hypothetical protein